jgi:hypothetical protein
MREKPHGPAVTTAPTARSPTKPYRGALLLLLDRLLATFSGEMWRCLLALREGSKLGPV